MGRKTVFLIMISWFEFDELVIALISSYLTGLILGFSFFQNSKFLQFVSKMSRGELILEDNQVKPAIANVGAGAWADEFHQQHPESWAAEFTAGEVRYYHDLLHIFSVDLTNYLVLCCDFLIVKNYSLFLQHVDFKISAVLKYDSE